MRLSKNKHIKGFTIIEVVLVLAVASAIFAMIFIALPAMQRTYRDFQRRQDIQRLHLAFEQYKDTNGGDYPWHKLPTNQFASWTPSPEAQSFIETYLSKDSTFKDPSGVDYSLSMMRYGTDYVGGGGIANSALRVGKIEIYGDARCRHDHDNLPYMSSGSYSIVSWREMGSNNTYCVTFDN